MLLNNVNFFFFNPAVEFASFHGKTAKGEVEEEKTD
jgi:hypothetical protein